jgi:hypothetical protein
MTPGVLEFKAGPDVARAACSPDGWDDADLARAFPFPSTEAGEPWVIAFYEAARVTGAKVLREPEPDPWPVAGGVP